MFKDSMATVLLLSEYSTVKPAYNGTTRDRIFFPIAGRSLFTQVLEIWILGDCESFPLKRGFCCPGSV